MELRPFTTPMSYEETIAQEQDTPHTYETVEHQEGSDNPITAVAGQFGMNGQIFLAQIINFLIVLVVLWRFVYKPIVRMLDARSEKIEKSIQQAEEIEKRVSQIEQEKNTIVSQARKEAQEIIEKAYEQGAVRQEEIVGAAKREVERVIAKGKEQLAQEKTAMVKEVRKDIVDIALKATARILKDQVDETKSKSLAEEVVRKLA